MLKAKVLQCDPEKEKLLMSFKTSVEGDAENPPESDFECEVGKVKKNNLQASSALLLLLVGNC